MFHRRLNVLRKCPGTRAFRADLSRNAKRPCVRTSPPGASKGASLLIVVSNTPARAALAAYKKRWAIECLFGDTKTRGLNLEGTGLVDPGKLDLLLALVALAVAWAGRTASVLIERGTLKRKAHGYYAKSWFGTGFDQIRRVLRTDPEV